MILNKVNKKAGFTLIELMVVVAIIGLLSSIVLASLGEAKIKANGAKIKQEAHQLKNAIELYRTTNGKYPFEELFSSVDNYNPNQYKTSNSTFAPFKTAMLPYIDISKLTIDSPGTEIYFPPYNIGFYNNGGGSSIFDNRCGSYNSTNTPPPQPPKGSYLFVFLSNTPLDMDNFYSGIFRTNIYCFTIE